MPRPHATVPSCIVLVLLLLAAAGPAHARPHAAPAPAPEGLVASGRVNRVYVPTPERFRPGAARRTATIVVNFNPGSCPSTGTVPWPADAQAAFQYAVDIWAAILNTTQTIEINACWRNDLASNVLGSAGPATFWENFTNAPQSNTYYPVALANQLADSDLNGGTAEINARFNSNFNWYFGTDGNPADDEYDFVSTVLHEIGHGLGFSGTANYDDGVAPAECSGTANTGCLGFSNGDPAIYDTFTENNAGTALTSYSSPSTALGNQITSDNVFFDAYTANFYNGGTRVELYAPTTWNGGSSYSHLGEVFNGTESALMTFSADLAEAIHYPGTVTIGLLVDLGWDIRNLANVWVDLNYTGTEIGGPTNPFDTMREGVMAVETDGTVHAYPGSYNEQFTVLKAMFIRADQGGSVIIGK